MGHSKFDESKVQTAWNQTHKTIRDKIRHGGLIYVMRMADEPAPPRLLSRAKKPHSDTVNAEHIEFQAGPFGTVVAYFRESVYFVETC